MRFFPWKWKGTFLFLNTRVCFGKRQVMIIRNELLIYTHSSVIRQFRVIHNRSVRNYHSMCTNFDWLWERTDGSSSQYWRYFFSEIFGTVDPTPKSNVQITIKETVFMLDTETEKVFAVHNCCNENSSKVNFHRTNIFPRMTKHQAHNDKKKDVIKVSFSYLASGKIDFGKKQIYVKIKLANLI